MTRPWADGPVIATVIRSVRKDRRNPVLVLDSGDVHMGTLFHTICREHALEFRLLKEMGYDAVALGNHEFDLMPAGLARILNVGAAKRQTAAGPPRTRFSARRARRTTRWKKLFGKTWCGGMRLSTAAAFASVSLR